MLQSTIQTQLLNAVAPFISNQRKFLVKVASIKMKHKKAVPSNERTIRQTHATPIDKIQELNW